MSLEQARRIARMVAHRSNGTSQALSALEKALFVSYENLIVSQERLFVSDRKIKDIESIVCQWGDLGGDVVAVVRRTITGLHSESAQLREDMAKLAFNLGKRLGEAERENAFLKKKLTDLENNPEFFVEGNESLGPLNIIAFASILISVAAFWYLRG